jgi:uncharacterized membrane protein YagU involved in acid resistance
MSLVMLALFPLLPRKEQYPLPPRLITEEMAEQVGADELLEGETKARAATWLAHFGYGAAVGTTYPLTAGRLGLPTFLQGMLFGLGVWTASYLGWLPAMEILPPATRTPARRNALMIVSHLVWGATIAILVDQFRKDKR